ncbi:MAG: ribosomal protein S18-alanine N-acetyltransferase [Desulfobacterales bacterium]|nr:MAG: ribosomal protein S18-alanine N-acetyltransferase [Desulfobacterales bacterium]
MAPWRISTLNPSDLEAVLAIETVSFQSPWRPLSFLTELSCRNADSYVVKLEAEQVIAYICLRSVADELHILKIAVAPQWRGYGVASWLLAECLGRASQQGLAAAYLEVRPSNRPARALYAKFGFQVIGKRRNYYPETREDALVMVKHFKEDL